MINKPAEMLAIMNGVGIEKANNRPLKTRLLGIMAGIFIALGAVASSTIAVKMGDSPMAPFMGALVFTIGIVSTLLAGAELFTGNMLVFIAFLNGEVSLSKMLINWARVFFWNLVGALFFVVLTYYTMSDPKFSELLMNVSEKKTQLDFLTAILLGFLCNVVVCLSVWTALAAKDALGKFVLSAFAVLIFVLLKYEHVVANMFYIPYGYLAGGNFTILDAIIKSFIPVTIGNMLGGMFLAAVYKFAYTPKEVK